MRRSRRIEKPGEPLGFCSSSAQISPHFASYLRHGAVDILLILIIIVLVIVAFFVVLVLILVVVGRSTLSGGRSGF
jgi:hypothetical protein